MNQSPRDIFDLYSLENDNSDFGVYKTEKKSNLFENDKQGMPDGDIFDQLSSKKEDRSFGIGETLKDVGQQIASKGAQGFLGAYGNIAELFGQGKENLTPGMEARFSREFEDPLQSEVEDYPSYARLPTGEDIGALIKGTTGVGEGKTPAGRIAGRGAEFVGGGAAIPLGMGAKAATTLAGAGAAGQSLREAGAPEALATGTEIVGTVLPGAIKGKVAPTGKEGKALAEGARSLGLSETEISPLLKSQKQIAALSKVARKGGKTKEIFESIKAKLGDSYDTLKKSPIAQSNIPPKQSSNLIKKFVDIETDLGKTLQPSPDKEAALTFIRKSTDKLIKDGATPEELINFWQDINKSVKWNSIQGGKKALTRLKEPILEALKDIDPNMAKNFELTNELYSKYAQVAKKLKPDLVDSFMNKAEFLSIGPSALGLAMGNPWIFAGFAGEQALRTLATEMITNPYFQNISNKLVKNLNSSSVKGIQNTLIEAKKHLEKKYPQDNWGFLTEEHSL